MRLNFQVQGHGRPLVILHGFLGSSDNWRSMSRRLSSHFTVYCLDLRNHGQSPHSDAMDYPIMAADLREFVEEQSLAQVFLLGHSMGGKVAMQFAGQYPERVDKLVVVDIAPKAYPPTHQSLLAALRAVDLRAAKNFSDIDSALSGPIPDSRGPAIPHEKSNSGRSRLSLAHRARRYHAKLRRADPSSRHRAAV